MENLDVISEYLSYPNISESISVTIITVSDSFTSLAFAVAKTGWNFFNPATNLSKPFSEYLPLSYPL